MPKKRIPGYRLHKPSGQGVVTLQGKDFYLGQYNSQASWALYQQLIADYLANDSKLPPIRQKNELLIEVAVLKFLEWAEGYYVKNGKPTTTFSHYRESLSHVIHWYGQSPVSDFGPLALQFIRDKLIEAGYVRKRSRRSSTIFTSIKPRWADKQILHCRSFVTANGMEKGRFAAVIPCLNVGATVQQHGHHSDLTGTTGDMVQRRCAGQSVR